jgi:hypothetical protein
MPKDKDKDVLDRIITFGKFKGYSFKQTLNSRERLEWVRWYSRAGGMRVWVERCEQALEAAKL